VGRPASGPTAGVPSTELVGSDAGDDAAAEIEIGEAFDVDTPTDGGSTAETTADPDDGTAPNDRPTGLIEPAELEDVVRTNIPEPTAGAAAETPGIDPGEPTGGITVTGPAPLDEELLAAITGFEPIDEPDADRALDLVDAAGIQPDPTEEVALLETRGFRGGWLRAFRNDHNDVAVASVYEFRDEAEAEFYLEDGLITIGGYGGTFFDIPDLPGVRGFAQDIASSDGEATESLVSLGASFHRGDRWYLLYFLGSPDRVTPEVLVPAIAAQVAAAGA
jgi:hypothetical protein